ncbi:polysaccharide deacetylase family protein [Acrocarpospora catenulata]|uniref:polysaccharide deacetylase family protein n=1 Tax=Acrocarpospora catenulata TaxID=2836182 RepID=UPI002023ABAF|nr:polysaccharide deacetylase family protein [Acrocarpospora catenulata]
MGSVGTVINLTVHGIGRPERELDPGEGDTWVSVAQFEQVLDAVVGREDVRVTFDDSNSSDLEIALPRLLERGLKAEFFVLAGLLGRPGRLTADGVRTLIKSGMRVGSHGWAHRDWRRIDNEQAVEELTDAHRTLTELTGRQVSRVAIPFGSYDRHVLRRLRRAGVTRAFTSDGGRARRGTWLQPRTSLVRHLDESWTRGVLRPPSAMLMARKLAGRAVKRVRG